MAHDSFRERAAAATRDTRLRAALYSATTGMDARRRKAWAELEDVEALRERAASIKDRVLGDLDRYLDQVTESLEKVGAHVHRARTREEATAIVVRIAREEGCRLAAKGKSMTTEEIDLNPALEAAGVEVVETDLGEYVIQLAGEKPSHITAPIVHKDVAAVSEVFERCLGVPPTDDAKVLVKAAREALRGVYRRFDLGITGANFVVAESGSVVIVMNEGNGRFCTSLPPTHVVVAGIEKLVPTLEDLTVFLRLLARSATGQKITTDTLLLTGPRRKGDADGPRSLHVVFLDAGRSRILASDQSSILRCIRCGACLNVCPVYRSIGGHAYGSVYPGPVGKILAPLLDPDGDKAALPRASTLCRACADVCPVKIDLPGLLVSLRMSVARPPWIRRQGLRVAALALRSPVLYRLLQRRIRGQLRRRSREGWIGSAPWPFTPWTDAERDLRAPPPRSFREMWRDRGER